MVRKAKECPNGHGLMHRCFISIQNHKKRRWMPVAWQYCPTCRIMLPD